MENIDNAYGRQKVNNIIIKKVPEILAHTQRDTELFSLLLSLLFIELPLVFLDLICLWWILSFHSSENVLIPSFIL